jgi:hypothetical protein
MCTTRSTRGLDDVPPAPGRSPPSPAGRHCAANHEACPRCVCPCASVHAVNVDQPIPLSGLPWTLLCNHTRVLSVEVQAHVDAVHVDRCTGQLMPACCPCPHPTWYMCIVVRVQQVALWLLPSDRKEACCPVSACAVTLQQSYVRTHIGRRHCRREPSRIQTTFDRTPGGKGTCIPCNVGTRKMLMIMNDARLILLHQALHSGETSAVEQY